MTSRTLIIEESLTGVGIAGQKTVQGIGRRRLTGGSAVQFRDSRVQVIDDVSNVRLLERYGRHALRRTPLANDVADQVPILVVANGGRHGQVGPFRSAGCVRTVAERAR